MVWLRAYLAGELAQAREVNSQVATPGAAAGIGALVHAALVVAARRKFTPTWTHDDVTRYVARVRGLLSEQPDVLDPLVAEQELRSALGERLTAGADPKSRGRAQFILLNALVQSLGLDEAGVADLLGRARGIADSLLAGGAGRPGSG
jgi:hypothetical protein